EKYLSRKGASEWSASLALQRYVKFQQGNLLGDRFDRGYDLIMCRNVVIYFNDAAKSALYQKFFDALRPGGYLFVGNTERIMESKEIGFES
ncbi:CheR family methyltransferase, partial [Klebsiella pneumoniae]|uniref:CheR family methyltransferase n=1 Tax=Klebsiella pneumoniae TaxID=573 RepID=UPI003EE2BB26